MRKLVLILGITCLIVWLLPHISSAKIDPEKVVGVWLFDEGAGNNVEDSSGKGNNGTINGAKWKDGKFGDGLEFDGGDWVSIPSTPELQVGEELTMMAWFYATNIGDWRQLIAKSDEYLLRIDPPHEQNKMSAFVNAENEWEPRASSRVPETNTWIHFAATYDSGANSDHLVVYVNGEHAGASSRAGQVAVTGNAVEIGKWDNGSYFVGIIDEVATFKDVLTEDDLKTIMDNGLDKALGGVAAVDASDKLATTWGTIKANR